MFNRSQSLMNRFFGNGGRGWLSSFSNEDDTEDEMMPFPFPSQDQLFSSSAHETAMRRAFTANNEEALTEFALQPLGRRTQNLNQGGGQYFCQSMSSVTTIGSDGKPITQKYMSRSSGDTRRNIHETRQAFADSATNLDRLGVERHVGGKGHRQVHERHRGTGEERRFVSMRGFDENQIEDFERDWQRERGYLPNNRNLFNRELGERERPSIYHHNQLPRSYPSDHQSSQNQLRDRR